MNRKSHEGLRESLMQCFRSVIVFSMNEEVLHTGFEPMASNRLAVASSLN